MAWIYKVVAINQGRVMEVIKTYTTIDDALKKLKKLQNHYPNDLGDTFAVIAERA